MSNVVQKVRDSIERYRMISRGDAVLAAVSGGPDSVCMLHVLNGLKDELGFDLIVAHLDHTFRGEESRSDAEFVTKLAGALGLPCRSKAVNVPKFLLCHPMSKQEAARLIRYRFLKRVAKQEVCHVIATGHNADDQAETVIMRLLRGAGPEGLAGIPPVREGTFVRPLLTTWRSEIEGYLAQRGLSYRIDSSNLESRYHRNRIRHELIPYLEDFNPGVKKTLVNLGTIMADIAAHLNTLTERAIRPLVRRVRLGEFALDLAGLAGYDVVLQRSILRRTFEGLRPDEGPLSFIHVENLLGLVRRGDVGASVELPDGARARVEHGCLVMTHGTGPRAIEDKELEVPGETLFEAAGLVITAEVATRTEMAPEPWAAPADEAFFDMDGLEPPIRVRPRRQGDRFQPFGMDGTKNLKQFYIDSKIPLTLRPAVPVLCDRRRILWVVGVRRGASAPVTEATKRVLVVRARTLETRVGPWQDPPHSRSDPESCS